MNHYLYLAIEPVTDAAWLWRFDTSCKQSMGKTEKKSDSEQIGKET